MSFMRVAAVSGFVFVALVFANVVLLGSPPLPGAAAADVREYVEVDGALHKAAVLALASALPFAMVFFAGVLGLLRASDHAHDEAWGPAVFGCGLLTGASALVGNGLFGLLVFRGGRGLDDASLQLLKDGELVVFAAGNVLVAAAAVCLAVPTFVHHVLPTWHGVLGILVACAGVVGTFALVTATDAAGLLELVAKAGLAVWVLATSAMLLRAAVGGGRTRSGDEAG
jgi:hypothetical protein